MEAARTDWLWPAPHHGGGGLGLAAHLHLACAIPNSTYFEMLHEPPGMSADNFQWYMAEPLRVWMPSLLQVGAEWREEGPGARAAEGRFRDELIAFARDSSEIAARELRRGLDDLDAFTRPERTGDEPSRRYRAKP